MSRSLHIRGAIITDAEEDYPERDLFIENGRIVPEKPTDALVIDLEGYTLFPGLINAHDHLELNHYPRTKFREVYDNAHQWGEDLNARLNEEPFKTLRSYPLWDRLFIGGLKNLLCGATTVAHHGSKYPEMYRRDFPVRVLKNYGWAHSLHFNTEAEIIRSYRTTPKDWPWFIHLAEGTDDIAAGEYRRLKKIGCVGENTVIVHGVGMTEEDKDDAARHIKMMVICPSTNDYLLRDRMNIETWRGNFMFGSDSRLTGDGDLLHETSIVSKAGDHYVMQERYRYFVWEIRDHVVSLPEVDDYLKPPADFLLGRPWGERKKLQCVALNGIPQIGDPDLMAKFPHIQTVACTLDGVEKRINVSLARQVHRCTLKEPGLEVDDLPRGKRFIFF